MNNYRKRNPRYNDDSGYDIDAGYSKTSRTIAWIAFIFSALAMFFAIFAFNRTGPDRNYTDSGSDMGDRNNTFQYGEGSDWIVAQTKTKAELLLLQAKIKTGQAGENIASEVRASRDKIKTFYNEKANLRGEAQDVDMNLQQIEADVRTNTAQGLQKLENLINKLEMNIERNGQ